MTALYKIVIPRIKLALFKFTLISTLIISNNIYIDIN